VISPVRRDLLCARYLEFVRKRDRTGKHITTGSLKEWEVLACIISILLRYRAAKDGATSWRSNGTIRELICAVKNKIQDFSIITMVYIINILYA
jgi:hypothetical protein